MSVAGIAGLVVLGAGSAGALGLIGAGAIAVFREQRILKQSMARIEATQRSKIDAARFQAAAARLTRDAAEAKLLLDRAKVAVGTIARTVRFAIAAVRLARSLF